MNSKVLGAAAGIAVLGWVVATIDVASAHDHSVRAVLTLADGRRIGTVDFRKERTGTEVRVRLSAAPGLDAFHGFHVHANNDPTNGEGCIADPGDAPSKWLVSADGHYNPTGQTHGHHSGDMPVVYVNPDGSVQTRFRLDSVDPADLAGKAVVLHAGPDNYANIPLGTSPMQYTANSPDAVATTSKTGNAGDRVACGVITVS